jgi:hypothetical protein
VNGVFHCKFWGYRVSIIIFVDKCKIAAINIITDKCKIATTPWDDIKVVLYAAPKYEVLIRQNMEKI